MIRDRKFGPKLERKEGNTREVEDKGKREENWWLVERVGIA